MLCGLRNLFVYICVIYIQCWSIRVDDEPLHLYSVGYVQVYTDNNNELLG